MPTPVRIAVLGDRNVDYVTHRELDAAIELLPDWAHGEWVPTDSPDARTLNGIDGLWVAPGSPYRDDAAVFDAIGSARERPIPMLGTCSGFQYTVMELARTVAGLDVAHAELDPDAEAPLIEPLRCSLIGQARTVSCVAGTRLADICGLDPFTGFHWCNYGVAGRFVEPLAAAGVTVSAYAPDAGVEAVEIAAHPFFLATLFQPQMGASDGGPLHPLIGAFVQAAREHAALGGASAHR